MCPQKQAAYPAAIPLRYEFVVDGTGHAFAIGRNVYPVQVIKGSEGITFLEVLKTGAVQTTTIQKTGKACTADIRSFPLLERLCQVNITASANSGLSRF